MSPSPIPHRSPIVFWVLVCCRMLAIWTVFGMPAVCLQAQDRYAGTWKGEGLTLMLERRGEAYAGSLAWRGRNLPLTGQIEDGVFYGEATIEQTRYSYLVEDAQERIKFTIDSKVYLLERVTGNSDESIRKTKVSPVKPKTPVAEGIPVASVRPGPDSRAPASQSRSRRLQFNRIPIDDSHGWIGGRAGTVLMPANWQSEARIQWFLHPTMPARITFTAVSPDRRHEIRMYPHLTYFHGPMIVSMNEYYGNTVAPPIGGAGALIRNIVLPGLHKGVNWRELGSEPLPNLSREIAALNAQPMANSTADGLRLRIAFEQNSSPRRQDLFGVYAVQRVGPAVYWQGLYIVTVTSDEKGIDEAAALVPVMLQSMQIELPWFNKMQQISDAFQQLVQSNIQLARRQSEIIRDLSDQVTRNRREAYENMSKSLDRTMDRFSEYIRGTETWQNHHDEPVSLPSGYTHAWQSDDGTILVSDSPGLNPNTDPAARNKNWHSMRR